MYKFNKIKHVGDEYSFLHKNLPLLAKRFNQERAISQYTKWLSRYSVIIQYTTARGETDNTWQRQYKLLTSDKTIQALYHAMYFT